MEKKILRFDPSDIHITGIGRIDDTKPINLAESVKPTEYGYPVNTVPSIITFSIKPELFTPAHGNRFNTRKTLIKMKNGLSPKR